MISKSAVDKVILQKYYDNNACFASFFKFE